MYLSRDEIEALTKRILAMSTAEACRVWLNGSEFHNVRLASRGGASNASGGYPRVNVQAQYGQRRGSAKAFALDDASLREAVERAEAAAKASPENPEVLPPARSIAYPPSAAYFDATAGLTVPRLANAVAPAAAVARASGLDYALFATAQRFWRAYATSAGAFGYDHATQTSFKTTMRNKRGTWSGWAGSQENDASRLDAGALARVAAEKASAAPDPVSLDPGKYTVLLEPAVVGQFVAEMMWNSGARWADEGRSFFSAPGGNKIGQKLFDERVTIASNPADPDAPGLALSNDGQANKPVMWVEGGVLKNLIRPVFWARKMKAPAIPEADFFSMRGGTDATADMIRDVKRGVLVTRLWYVRTLDRRKLLVTGLTRDGTFLIENGKVTRPVNNFRFNESPAAVLNNILAMGPARRALLAESNTTLSVPALLVKDFTFSSISPAV